MLNALVAGQRDPRALAQLARGNMRGKIRRREEALDCSFFTGEHAAVLAMMLAATGHYTTQTEALNARIETLTGPCLHQVTQLDAVHGIGPVCAQDIIAEIGAGMTAFPTASHLVSWAKWSPQARQPAGKRKGSNATGRGNPYLSAALGEAAISAGNTQSFLGARYRRLTRRMPKKKALVAATPSSPSSTPCWPTRPPAIRTSAGMHPGHPSFPPRETHRPSSSAPGARAGKVYSREPGTALPAPKRCRSPSMAHRPCAMSGIRSEPLQ
jgi:hypothetical protein